MASPDDQTSVEVSLPQLRPGGRGRDDLLAALDGWVRSDALQQLAYESGWSWPVGSTAAVVAQLVSSSEDWDFRKRLFDMGERHALTSIAAEVNGVTLDEEMIAKCAAVLGLAGVVTASGPFTHIVVLGGMARACLNRTREAARRLDDDAGARMVALVTAHRPLGGSEPADARELGWGELALESEAAAAAVREVFDLPAHPDVADHLWWAGDVPPVPENYRLGAGDADRRSTWPDEWRWRNSWACWRWDTDDRTIEVAVSPSAYPLVRRTNTADQLAWWSDRADIGWDDNVLLITTDHYVPAQHFHAIRTLGLARECGVSTCGVTWHTTGEYRGAAYLQEVRSALLAAQHLLGVLDAED
jgi:hypothetical protein